MPATTTWESSRQAANDLRLWCCCCNFVIYHGELAPDGVFCRYCWFTCLFEGNPTIFFAANPPGDSKCWRTTKQMPDLPEWAISRPEGQLELPI